MGSALAARRVLLYDSLARTMRTRDQPAEALDAWQRKEGPTFLRSLGIHTGAHVIDFGCGPGGYVLPLASAVGRLGRVIALDNNPQHLESVRRHIAGDPRRGVVEIHRTDGRLTLDGIDDASLDTVLLFDVLQHIKDWATLFTSLRRVLKVGGLLLVNPSHLSHPGCVNVKDMRHRLAEHGFAFQRTKRGRVMHYDALRVEEIFVFRVSHRKPRPNPA